MKPLFSLLVLALLAAAVLHVPPGVHGASQVLRRASTRSLDPERPSASLTQGPGWTREPQNSAPAATSVPQSARYSYFVQTQTDRKCNPARVGGCDALAGTPARAGCIFSPKDGEDCHVRVHVAPPPTTTTVSFDDLDGTRVLRMSPQAPLGGVSVEFGEEIRSMPFASTSNTVSIVSCGEVSGVSKVAQSEPRANMQLPLAQYAGTGVGVAIRSSQENILTGYSVLVGQSRCLETPSAANCSSTEGVEVTPSLADDGTVTNALTGFAECQGRCVASGVIKGGCKGSSVVSVLDATTLEVLSKQTIDSKSAGDSILKIEFAVDSPYPHAVFLAFSNAACSSTVFQVYRITQQRWA